MHGAGTGFGEAEGAVLKVNLRCLHCSWAEPYPDMGCGIKRGVDPRSNWAKR